MTGAITTPVTAWPSAKRFNCEKMIVDSSSRVLVGFSTTTRPSFQAALCAQSSSIGAPGNYSLIIALNLAGDALQGHSPGQSDLYTRVLQI
jgi:hypothetical protein